MYALGLPISVHSTAPEDPVGSQEIDDMKYVAINDTIVHLDQPRGYGTDVRRHHRGL